MPRNYKMCSGSHSRYKADLSDVISCCRHCGGQISQIIRYVYAIAHGLFPVLYAGCPCRQLFALGSAEEGYVGAQGYPAQILPVSSNRKSKISEHKVYSAHNCSHSVAVRVGNYQTAGGGILADLLYYSPVFVGKVV